MGGAVLAREGNPVVRLAVGGWDAQLRHPTPSIRRLLRSHTRRLEAARPVRTGRRTACAADLNHDGLLAPHCARRGATAVVNPETSFHREFASIALERRWLRRSFPELDDEDVAADYHQRFARPGYVYQGGWLPAREHDSVATIALLRSIHIACDEGLCEIRFLRGHAAYKCRYADADPALQTITGALRRAAAGAVDVARVALRNVLKPVPRGVAAT